MPNLEWNGFFWQNQYNWKSGGEDWSRVWGGSAAQWHGAIFPRIAPFLPVANILEIAPGFGRMTRFLLPHAARAYRAVDIAACCTVECQGKFSDIHPDFKALTNDGLSLDCVADKQYDFIFSFDSLVHASENILQSYCKAILSGLLSERGVAFIHHANLKGAAEEKMVIGLKHKRDETVSAQELHEFIEANNGKVLRQEIIAWGEDVPIQAENACIDTFTLFCNENSAVYKGSGPTVILNPDFIKEAQYINKFFSPYYTL